MAEILRKPETLRKMLDERGVEHYDRFDVTEWVGSDGEICHTSVIHSNGATVLVLRKCVTPAQAVEATLGRGTCRMEKCKDYRVGRVSTSWGCVCSNCGAFHEFTHGDGWNFCPNCGRRIEVDA